MRVLVVEDEPALAAALAATLKEANMIATMAGNGLHAASMLSQAARSNRPYDVVILDLTLPGMDGLDVLKGMRESGVNTGVLILTARSSLADRVGGLETGADDYLPKPYEAAELVARVRAIHRRRTQPTSTQVSVGNLGFDAAKGVFNVEGAMLQLPRRSQVILEALFRRRGGLVPKDFFANLDEEGASPESVDTQMSRLRRRLRDAGASVQIKTMHGSGYVLEAGVGESGDAGAA